MPDLPKSWRVLITLVLGAACLALVAYTRWQILSANAMEAAQAAYEVAWRGGYRLSLQDFRICPNPDAHLHLGSLTNQHDFQCPWPLPETTSWLRSTFVDAEASPESPLVPWSEVESLFTDGSLDVFMDAVEVLNDVDRIEFPTDRWARRTGPHLAELMRLDAGLLMELGALLHQAQRENAWQHVLAITRLATRLKPAPARNAHTVRLWFVQAALISYWSFERCFAPSEKELTEALQLWQEFNVLHTMPNLVAFTRCEYLSMLAYREPYATWYTLRTLGGMLSVSESLGSKWGTIRASIRNEFREWSYRHLGSYEDELRLIQQTCLREEALREAIQAETWPEMSRLLHILPNPWPTFAPNSRAASICYMRQSTFGYQSVPQASDVADPDWMPFVEAESLRRLAIAGLMIRIETLRTGEAPTRLSGIADMPKDFRTGQDFIYRPLQGQDFELLSPLATNALPPKLFDPDRVYPRTPQLRPILWPSRSGQRGH